MEATASMHASIDEKLRDQAISVLAEMGLTVSGIVRMSLTRIARDEALPSALESRRGPHPRYFRIRPAREGGRRGSGDHKHNVPEVYRAEQGGRAAGAPPVYRGIDRWRTSRHLHRPSTQRPSMLWPVPNAGPSTTTSPMRGEAANDLRRCLAHPAGLQTKRGPAYTTPTSRGSRQVYAIIHRIRRRRAHGQ